MTEEEQKPPRVKPSIKFAPKIKQLYWCKFPLDAQLPEFWKNRPVVILSYNNSLTGKVSIIPCSSQDQKDNKWAIKLTKTIDGKDSWAICDNIMTIAVSRLSMAQDGIKLVSEEDMQKILYLVHKQFPFPKE